MRRFALAVLAAAIWGLPAERAGAGFFRHQHLVEIAGDIPAGAEGMVSLLDIAAIRHESRDFIQQIDDETAMFLPFAHLALPPGFDGDSLFQAGPELGQNFGFGLGDIGLMAGWGNPPETPVVLGGEAPFGDEVALGAALGRRGFETRRVGGVTVWHRQNDGANNLARSNEDPFVGPAGLATRYAFQGGRLLMARSWGGIEAMLEGGPSLMDDAEARALIEAAYRAGFEGTPVQIVLPGPRPSRTEALGRLMEGLVEIEAPGWLMERFGPDAGAREVPEALPPFGRHALIQWQDGARFTGAIALSYGDPAMAELAVARFDVLLAEMFSSLVLRPFAEILPYRRDFRIVTVAGRQVVLLGFEYEVEGSPGLTMFQGTPFQRLLDMVLNRDLDLLIGRDGP